MNTLTVTPDVAGAPVLLRFMLRRGRRGFAAWVVAAGLLTLVQSVQSQSFYGDAEELAKLRATAEGNPAVIAMSGPLDLLDTVGGEVVFEMFTYIGILVALMSMFMVARNTRGEEETGRAELLRSARVGHDAPLFGALALAALANAAVAIIVASACLVTGLPAGGSLLFGLALGATGLTFAGITAVAAQIFENVRGVYGMVVAAIGVSYALRAAGDVGDGTLSWLSPIGWGQRTLPFVADRWWVLLVPLAVAAVLVTIAVAMTDRRDFGAGLIATRPGPANASWALSTPLGLAWRLHRGSMLGWATGAFALGVLYGSLADAIQQYVADNPEIAEFLPGGPQRIVDSYLAITMGVTVLVATAYGVAAALRARGEEAAGRLEPVLATATSRAGWLGSHVVIALLGSAAVIAAGGVGVGAAYGLTISDPGQVPRLMTISLAYVPAIWVVVGVAVLAAGALPRHAGLIAWAAMGYTVVVTFFGNAFELPAWLRWPSPLDHLPQVPLDDVRLAPLVVLLLIAAALVVGGLSALRRRDVEWS